MQKLNRRVRGGRRELPQRNASVLIFMMVLAMGAPVWAAVSVETGNGSLGTGTTSHVFSTGFQYKAVILISHGKTTEGESEGNGDMLSIGFSDGTNHRVAAVCGDDAQATSQAGKFWLTTQALRICTDASTPTTGTGGQVTGVSFGASSMTLTTNANPASAWEVSWIGFGGADIANVSVGTLTGCTTAACTVDVATGWNGTNGNAMLFLISSLNTAADTGTANWKLSFGWATSSTQDGAVCSSVLDNQATQANVNAGSQTRNDGPNCGLNTASETQDYIANFTRWNQAGDPVTTGFRIAFPTASTSAYQFGYLAMNGGRWDAGVQAKPTGATTQTVTGMSWQPKGVGFAMTEATAVNTRTVIAHTVVGAMTGASNEVYAGAYHDDADTSDTAAAGASTRVLRDMNNASNVEADFTSFNSDGWTITWTAAGQAEQVAWWAVTDNAAGGGGATYPGWYGNGGWR